jgi:hypothetical protein
MIGHRGEVLGPAVVVNRLPRPGRRGGVLLRRGGSSPDAGNGVIGRELMVSCIARGGGAGLAGEIDESTFSLVFQFRKDCSSAYPGDIAKKGKADVASLYHLRFHAEENAFVQ